MKEEEEKPGGTESKWKDEGAGEEGKRGGKGAPERKEPEAVTVEPQPTPELKTLHPLMQGDRCDNPGEATIRYKKGRTLNRMKRIGIAVCMDRIG